ncbi:MAG: S41 family peptidase [Bacteroidota bacterium]
MRTFMLILIFLSGKLLIAQSCDCPTTLSWLQSTFSENDAGFAYVMEQKGEKAYAAHNAAMEIKAQAAPTHQVCLPVLEEWLTYFRDGHIGIEWISQPEVEAPQNEENKRAIKAKFKDWPQRPVNRKSFEAALAKNATPGYEGIWRSGVYLIAIQQDDDGYTGSILEADGVYWRPDQVKLRIDPKADSAVFYMKDHSPRFVSHPQLIGKNYLEIGFVQLERVAPKFDAEPEKALYIRAMDATYPFVEYLDERTAYLRIPSFNNFYRPFIDSLVAAEKPKLLQHPNLIIDLRGNGGGSDASYASLSPLLYTHPIHTVGVEFLSTKLNNQRMLAFAENDEYNFTEEEKEWARESYETLSAQLGKFVNLDESVYSVDTIDTVYTHPSDVAILINEENGSTTEQFLLEARQSAKVKLYGSTTYGVLDISNMMNVNDPCENFTMYYSLSRSMRIPGLAIDGKGISPDFYMHRDIPNHEWIEFVRERMGE